MFSVAAKPENEVKGLGYLLLLLATLLWSFVGILVKTASVMVDSSMITFARFFFGIVFLGLYMGWKGLGFKLQFGLKWVWLGALGKSLNYICENLALSIGYSYGNILLIPLQTILLLLVSALFLKEHITARRWVAAISCILGVLLISWNGMSLSGFRGDGAWTTGLYVLGAVGVALHVLSQKMLIEEMDAGNMNLSIFLLCTLMTALPLPFELEWPETYSILGIGALLALGLITGLSFYWFTQAMKTVPFSTSVIVSNSSILFSVLWSHLFYQEPITFYLIAGITVCMAGLLLIQLPVRLSKGRRRRNEEHAKAI